MLTRCRCITYDPRTDYIDYSRYSNAADDRENAAVVNESGTIVALEPVKGWAPYTHRAVIDLPWPARRDYLVRVTGPEREG